MRTTENRARYDCSKLRYSSDLSTGCQWAAIPKDLPARSTLHDDLDL